MIYTMETFETISALSHISDNPGFNQTIGLLEGGMQTTILDVFQVIT